MTGIFRNIIQFTIEILPHLKMGLFSIKHAESTVRQRRVPNSSRSATALKFLPGHLFFDYILEKYVFNGSRENWEVLMRSYLNLSKILLQYRLYMLILFLIESSLEKSLSYG